MGFLNKLLNKCKKNWTNFAKIMRIVNEILLKIWEKLKKNNFFKIIWILKNLLKIRDKLCSMYIVEYMRLINDKIRNFK